MSAPDERALSAPAALTVEHDLEQFGSGTPPFDDWLKRRARQNEISDASRSYVIAEGRRVVGYYSLAAGSVLHEASTGRVRRNMPDPVPVALLGRLAVDRGWRGKGLGAALLAMPFSGSSAPPGRSASARSSCMRFRTRPRHFTSTGASTPRRSIR